MPDVEIARAMMRSAVPLEVSDEAIKNTCHYIGNVLINKAQDLASDINYLSKHNVSTLKMTNFQWCDAVNVINGIMRTA